MSAVLPGDVGRRVLGPFADARAVAALNEELGTDRPLVTQYLDWIGGVLTGDFGESQAFRRPVGEVLGPALRNSAKLAVLAFIIVVPLAILGGVFAALHEGNVPRPVHHRGRVVGDRDPGVRLGRAC